MSGGYVMTDCLAKSITRGTLTEKILAIAARHLFANSRHVLILRKMAHMRGEDGFDPTLLSWVTFCSIASYEKWRAWARFKRPFSRLKDRFKRASIDCSAYIKFKLQKKYLREVIGDDHGWREGD